MKTEIVVKVDFDGIHQWKECNIPEVNFLRNDHRHKFYVTLTVEVCHSNRDIEFFILQRELRKVITSLYSYPYDKCMGMVYELGNRSCETIAQEILLRIKYSEKLHGKIFDASCSVFEDNENGAIVTTKKEDGYCGGDVS